MKLNKIVLLLSTITFVGLLIALSPQALCVDKANDPPNKKKMVNDSSGIYSERDVYLKTTAGFDSIVVFHFHPTAQCSCCINVGNFSKKGLEKFYAKPYKDGRIVFRECNIDEDSLTAKKYQIFWSALGFTKLSKGKNEFKEIESVWEFCEDEVKFLPTFKKELDEFMGGSKEEKPQTKAQDEKAKQGEEQMMGKAKEILKTKKIYAVMGVSQDRSKYGYEVFHSLQQAGYKTYPINPKYAEIAGHKCYASLEDLPENPEVVILTLAPSNSEKMIENFSKSKIQMLWLPPGCWSDAAVEKCQKMSIPLIYDVCPVGTLLAMKEED